MLNFGEDLKPDPDVRIFSVILHHLERGPKVIYTGAQYLKWLRMDSANASWTGWVCEND